MELEFRYYVFKNSDLTKGEREILESVGGHVDARRHGRNAPPLGGIFIEVDWPEFEYVEAMLMERIAREEAEE